MQLRINPFVHYAIPATIIAGLVAGLVVARAPEPYSTEVERELRVAADALKKDDYTAALRTLNGLDQGAIQGRQEALFLTLRSQALLIRASEYPVEDAEIVDVVNDLREARAVLGDNDAVVRRLAEAFEKLGAYPEAEAMYGIAIKSTLVSPVPHLLARAAGYRDRGEYERAMADLDKALGVYRDDYAAGMAPNYHRGRLFFKMGRYEDADASFLKGLHGQANYPWVYIYMGCTGARLGKYAQALEDYTKGVELLHGVPGTSPAAEHNIAAAGADLDVIREMAKAGSDPQGKAAKLCEGFWSDRTGKRERSPLLPATVPL